MCIHVYREMCVCVCVCVYVYIYIYIRGVLQAPRHSHGHLPGDTAKRVDKK